MITGPAYGPTRSYGAVDPEGTCGGSRSGCAQSTDGLKRRDRFHGSASPTLKITRAFAATVRTRRGADMFACCCRNPDARRAGTECVEMSPQH